MDSQAMLPQGHKKGSCHFNNFPFFKNQPFFNPVFIFRAFFQIQVFVRLASSPQLPQPPSLHLQLLPWMQPFAGHRHQSSLSSLQRQTHMPGSFLKDIPHPVMKHYNFFPQSALMQKGPSQLNLPPLPGHVP